LIAAFPIMLEERNLAFMNYFMNPYSLLLFSILMSFLLISEIPLISLKFKTANFSENILRYILIGSSLVLILLFQFAASPIILMLYLLISIVYFKQKTSL
jgi:CDP-diacylglycerol--serine O-phosphatidyltransferase